MEHDNSNDIGDVASGNEALRELSPLAFAEYGKGHWAFVKSVVVEGETAVSLHGADGQQLAVVADRDVAFALLRQHDLEPLSVH
jgi:Protein of unknown function (DUF1150)